MNPEDLVNQAGRIISGSQDGRQKLVEAQEFLRLYAGENSSFFKQISGLSILEVPGLLADQVKTSLSAFIEYVRNGLLDGVSIKRQAEMDVVSEFLEQAQNLLDINEVHPASPTMIIGAVLEEFLRNWVSDVDLSIEGKPGIDSYAKALRKDDLIEKQDIKDITSWAGLRNHAAHGEWEKVSDKKRIGMMFDGVNLFMRRYGGK